jgi:hypothetical protein
MTHRRPVTPVKRKVPPTCPVGLPAGLESWEEWKAHLVNISAQLREWLGEDAQYYLPHRPVTAGA